MDGFYSLSTENQQSAVRLYEELVSRDYAYFERCVSEKEFNEIRKERRKVLSKMRKCLKDNIVRDLYNGKYGVHH